MKSLSGRLQALKDRWGEQNDYQADNEVIATYEHYLKVHGPDEGTVKALAPEVERIQTKRERERT